MDVFFFEAFEEETKLLQHFLDKNIKAGFTKATIQEYGQRLPPARLISTRVQSVIPPEWANLLEGIHSRSTGYEHLQKYAQLNRPSLHIGYLPLYCNRAVAEHAVMVMMCLMKKMTRQIRQFKNFHRDGITGVEFFGKNMLVVGVGNIGIETMRLGKALGMKVKGVDIEQKFPEETHYVSIEEGIGQADVIICAMNQTHDNFGYFTYELLKKAKQGAIFINVSRGELSHSGVLLQLMEEGHLGGVSLDAFNKEEVLSVCLRQTITTNEPEVVAAMKLMEKENVIFTPHNAFNTQESTERKAEQSIRQIAYFLENGHFLWPVPAEEA